MSEDESADIGERLEACQPPMIARLSIQFEYLTNILILFRIERSQKLPPLRIVSMKKNGEPMEKRFVMRDSKPFTVITYTKPEEPKLYFHCPNHKSVRLIRTKMGWICPEGCGYTSPATIKVETDRS